MVGIINYGAGNIRSICSSVVACGRKVFLIEAGDDFKKAEMVILPGVGAFGDGMNVLSLKGIIEPLIEEIKKGKPFLGICLGMQMLFSHSEEGNCKGLGIIPGEVKRFSVEDKGLKVPHMGWNRVELIKQTALFHNVDNNQFFYFAHSYYGKPDDTSVIVGQTTYGIEFASFIRKDNIVGVQFHPEKSGEIGIRFLKNFLEGIWLQ